MLLLVGPLVGVSFISAVRTYAEASGLNGTAAGVGEAFSPLVGIWAPTFSACELAAAFLLPFVAIRQVAGDRQSGALKIELQQRLPAFARFSAKALVLVGGWLIASGAPLLAIVLWRSYGGSVYLPELMTVLLGHFLNAGLTVALAAATASLTEHPSTAAILTLGVTVGTWIVNFIAAVQGGIWERAAGYTPTAMVSEFQHGLVRLDVVLIAATLILSGLALGAIWSRLGVAVARRLRESVGLAALAAAAALSFTLVNTSWDTSENRGNSFSEADERALEGIRAPLAIEAHLAPEDPRRFDLEHRALSKLRRVMPKVQVRYVSSTSIGMFEQTAPHYGEIWYDLGGRRAVSRMTTAEGVLETVYSLAGVVPPVENGRGVPRASARGSAEGRGDSVLWHLAGARRRRRTGRSGEVTMRWLVRRELLVCALVGIVAPLVAADTKVDLTKEQVGKPPAALEPMVGSWVIAQDGGEKVVMVDGRPWVTSKDNPSKLLIESARKLYGTSNEELMDNAKQFAYYPVALVKGVSNFTNGTMSMKFKTVSGESDRCSGMVFNVKPNGDWLAIRYNDTENNIVLWEFHNGIRRSVKRGPERTWMLDRAAWHELKATVDGASFKAWIDGNLALEHTLGSAPGPGRNNAAPNPDLFPENNAVLRPPVEGRVGLWSKTDSTSYFKDLVISPK